MILGGLSLGETIVVIGLALLPVVALALGLFHAVTREPPP